MTTNCRFSDPPPPGGGSGPPRFVFSLRCFWFFYPFYSFLMIFWIVFLIDKGTESEWESSLFLHFFGLFSHPFPKVDLFMHFGRLWLTSGVLLASFWHKCSCFFCARFFLIYCMVFLASKCNKELKVASFCQRHALNRPQPQKASNPRTNRLT